MDVLEAISGNRVNYAINRPGGSTATSSTWLGRSPRPAAIRTATEREPIPVLTTHRAGRARCAGVGVLTGEDARRSARSVRRARLRPLPDIRRRPRTSVTTGSTSSCRSASPAMCWHASLYGSGVVESCRIIEQALDGMPAGPWSSDDFLRIPAGEACARIEGPRGEVFYDVASDGSDVPTRVRIRTPTFQNMPTVRPMVRGMTLADAPLIQALIDPCYSCTDR